MGLPAKPGFIVRCNVHGTPNGKTHVWNGSDTCCHMWSTGGLDQRKRWDYCVRPPTKLCHNCHAERHVPEELLVACNRSEEGDDCCLWLCNSVHSWPTCRRVESREGA